MDASLAAYLRGRTPVATQHVSWPHTGGEFDCAAYLVSEPPPLELVVSARAILVRDRLVLAFESGTGSTHVIPGGRRQPGESLEQTLVREVREETGCVVAAAPRQVGVIVMHDCNARREGSPYPYPDGLWVMYAATAQDGGTLCSEDEWVHDPRFVDPATLPALGVSPVELAFVDAARAAVVA